MGSEAAGWRGGGGRGFERQEGIALEAASLRAMGLGEEADDENSGQAGADEDGHGENVHGPSEAESAGACSASLCKDLADLITGGGRSEFPDEIEGEAIFEDAIVLVGERDFIGEAEVEALPEPRAEADGGGDEIAVLSGVRCAEVE